MIRNLKVLGLALVAVFAMSAMLASAASAHTPAEFTSAADTTTLTGTQIGPETVFTVTGVGVTCSTANYHGHVSGKTALSVTATPTYTGCKTSVGTAATVTGFGHFGETKKCDYLLHASGTADLVCDPGAEVTVDAGPCTVHIAPQTNLESITYTNELNEEEKHNGAIILDINITNIEASHTDGFLCPFNGSGTTTGTLVGSATVTGEDPVNKEPIAITYDPTVE